MAASFPYPRARSFSRNHRLYDDRRGRLPAGFGLGRRPLRLTPGVFLGHRGLHGGVDRPRHGGHTDWQVSVLLAAAGLIAGALGWRHLRRHPHPLLRRCGFRPILIINGLASGASILVCGWLEPRAAALWPLLALFTAGLTRSMQFICLNTLGFADLSPTQNTSASTLASMLVQISMAAGVGIGALTLQASPLLHESSAAALVDYRGAFGIVGLLGMVSALRFLRLPHTAGAEVSGRAH